MTCKKIDIIKNKFKLDNQNQDLDKEMNGVNHFHIHTNQKDSKLFNGSTYAIYI